MAAMTICRPRAEPLAAIAMLACSDVPSMITCAVDSVIDPTKIEAFERFARR
jgi:hypothetical protein